jgi:hypothetical protein
LRLNNPLPGKRIGKQTLVQLPETNGKQLYQKVTVPQWLMAGWVSDGNAIGALKTWLQVQNVTAI